MSLLTKISLEQRKCQESAYRQQAYSSGICASSATYPSLSRVATFAEASAFAEAMADESAAEEHVDRVEGVVGGRCSCRDGNHETHERCLFRKNSVQIYGSDGKLHCNV